MSYKIVLLGASLRLKEKLSNRFEDLSHSVRFIDDNQEAALLQSYDQLHDWMADCKPHVLVNLRPLFGEVCSDEKSRVVNVSRICEALSIKAIHLSSYHVFLDAPNDHALEHATPCPTTPFGFELVALEQAIFEHHKQSIILRTPWLVDDSSQGLLAKVCRSLHANSDPVKCHIGIMNHVVSCDELERVIVALVQQILCGADNWGFFHLCASEPCSEIEFVECVRRILLSLGHSVTTIEESETESLFNKLGQGGLLLGNRLSEGFGVQKINWHTKLKALVEHCCQTDQACETQV